MPSSLTASLRARKQHSGIKRQANNGCVFISSWVDFAASSNWFDFVILATINKTDLLFFLSALLRASAASERLAVALPDQQVSCGLLLTKSTIGAHCATVNLQQQIARKLCICGRALFCFVLFYFRCRVRVCSLLFASKRATFETTARRKSIVARSNKFAL